MVSAFQVSELLELLGFAGCNTSGRKHELVLRALHLLESGCSRAVHIKIKELYDCRYPRVLETLPDRESLKSSVFSLEDDSAVVFSHPSATTVYIQGLVSEPQSSLAHSSVLLHKSKHRIDMQQSAPPIPPVHPDVQLKSLPFYDVLDVLIKPSSLETSCPQEDNYPNSLCIKVNGKLFPLPGYAPPPKNGVEQKRPGRPLNITSLVRLSSAVPNQVSVTWAPEIGKTYSISVFLVRQLTSSLLLQRLKMKGIRNPDHSRALSPATVRPCTVVTSSEPISAKKADVIDLTLESSEDEGLDLFSLIQGDPQHYRTPMFLDSLPSSLHSPTSSSGLISSSSQYESNAHSGSSSRNDTGVITGGGGSGISDIISLD
ncbi:hypothetical protein JZ751_011856 [Albula glossodonta]|uniref:Uncharacterized protein n=1 Tax=Albula glossodonta TaxID=121402 RepID=A0A8T2PQV7_9TELE|nr:hypothetical protein JZ751_011856 [Albula glossodonta]